MRIICQNIKGTPKMRFRHVREDLATVKSYDPDVVGLQEMKWAYYWAAMSVFGARNWGRWPRTFLGPMSSQPIIWDRRVWALEKRKRYRLHDAMPGVSQERFVVAVLLRHRETGKKAWFKNTHYFPGAMHDAGLMSEWREANNGEQRFTRKLLRDGWPVFSTGDYNKEGSVAMRAEYLTPVERIDKIFLTGAQKAKVKARSWGTIPLHRLHTDHGGLIADWIWNNG